MRVLLAACVAALALGCFVGEELERGDKLMEQLGPGKAGGSGPAAPASAPAPAAEGPSLSKRVGSWWERASAPAPTPPDPSDRPVACTLEGSVRFMRASDCELRGGRASAAARP